MHNMYMITIDDKLSQHHKNGEAGVVDGQNCRYLPCYSSQFQLPWLRSWLSLFITRIILDPIQWAAWS